MTKKERICQRRSDPQYQDQDQPQFYENYEELKPFIDALSLSFGKFPYALPVTTFPKTSPNRPLLTISEKKQTLHSYLKDTIKGTLQKKLHSCNTLFEFFVDELFNHHDVKGMCYYPPKSLNDIDQLISHLKSLNGTIVTSNAASSISIEFKIGLVLSYFIRDFYSVIPIGVTEQTIHQDQISKYHEYQLGKHLGWFNFISLIYHLDRFDFNRTKSFLNLSQLSSFQFSKRFQRRFFKMLNITPSLNQMFSDMNNTSSQISSLSELSIHLKVQTSRSSSLTVHTVVMNNSHPLYKVSPKETESDILLIYLDSMTDIAPLEALRICQSSGISSDTMTEIVIKKIIVKSIKELELLKELKSSNKISSSLSNITILKVSLPWSHILTYPKDPQFDQILKTIVNKEAPSCEGDPNMMDLVYKKFPKFFHDFQLYDSEIRYYCSSLLYQRSSNLFGL
ncbi:hypothetical protein WICPIJ_009746 [Wickerhamomyces pijperi]|uniref:Uncharacterized protein n=1 Tax=Wickerhamomyces pijperi TaxID=599730 RepID=A0A9P8TBK2_WICPI|nr:hypothetical protein WICPIJ_009746 [Wickerhamomyces pijperi]